MLETKYIIRSMQKSNLQKMADLVPLMATLIVQGSVLGGK